VLDVAWRAYGLLDPAGGDGGRVLILVSVPARALTPISTAPIGYGFRMRVVARSGPHLVEIDTVRRLAVRSAPGPDDMITFTSELSVPAGMWRVGAAIEQPADTSGQYFSDGEVSVPAGAGRLALSDIVLGAAAGGRPWTAPDGPFALSPTGSYRRGEPVPVYYEVAGAGGGTDLETEITFTPEEEERGVTVGFREEAAGPVLRVRRELGTERLNPGPYRLRVTVTGPGGASATRETRLYVMQP
jgi:hypothetical protein